MFANGPHHHTQSGPQRLLVAQAIGVFHLRTTLHATSASVSPRRYRQYRSLAQGHDLLRYALFDCRIAFIKGGASFWNVPARQAWRRFLAGRRDFPVRARPDPLHHGSARAIEAVTDAFAEILTVDVAGMTKG